jgi:cytochrome c biogenesis protein
VPKPLVDDDGRRFSVRCDDFTLDRFKDGSARRFSSQLVVLDEAGREVKSKRIIVNDPLEHAGMKFYQASYQERPDQSRALVVLGDRETGETRSFAASPETTMSLGDGRIRFAVVNYDRAFGELGPAVQVVREERLSETERRSTNFWVFANHPEFDREFRGDRYWLKFERLEPSYVTGIQVGYDPGIPWIYLGCFVLFAGLFVTFWTAHRRVWARVEPGGVTFAGAAHRNKEAFEREFGALLARLGAAPPDADAEGQAA